MASGHLDFTGYAGRRAHLGVTGSVAAFKSLALLRRLLATGAGVSVTLTEAATRFVTALSFEALGADPVYTTMFSSQYGHFDHLSPAQTADVMAIVPATADTMARLAHGLAGDLLACQALAFEGPLLVAPAMNTRMWRAAATRDNWATLLSRGVIGIEPGSGAMACGETGDGRLASDDALFAAILKALTPQDMAGRKVLVSLGPTREYFDAARFWSNPSTGRMGACVAMAAWLRGATVSVISGPVSWWFPDDVTVVPVTSAAQMYDACLGLWPDQHMAVMTAAVADFAPLPYAGGGKFKKNAAKDGTPPLSFLPTRDILAAMGAAKAQHQRLVGFCAETAHLVEYAGGKLEAKRCDVIVANRIGQAHTGFAAPSNQAVLLAADGRREHTDTIAKTELAWKLWDFTIRS